jgi:hypothetical protein
MLHEGLKQWEHQLKINKHEIYTSRIQSLLQVHIASPAFHGGTGSLRAVPCENMGDLPTTPDHSKVFIRENPGFGDY